MRTPRAIRAAAACCVVVGLALVPSASLTVAQEREAESWDLAHPPRFFNARQVRPEGSASWLTMRCEGQAPRYRRVRCSFEQQLVWQPSEEYVREQMAEFDRGTLSARELAAARRGCLSSPDTTEEIAACRCFTQPDDERPVEDERTCFRRELRRHAERRVRACRIRNNRFSVELERVGRTRWTGRVRGGICSNVTVVVLDARNDFLSWTFTQTRVAVDDENDPICGGLEAGTVSRFDTGADDYVPSSCQGLRPAL